MAIASMAAMRRAVDAHRYRKDAAAALGVPAYTVCRRFPIGRMGPAYSDAMAAEMHRVGLPLDRVMTVCGLSAARIVRAVQAAEKVEIERISLVASRTFGGPVSLNEA